MINAKALRLAQRGRCDEGMRLAGKLAVFGKKIGDNNPLLVDFSTGIALRSIAYGTMCEIAGNYPVSPECLREVRETVRETRASKESMSNALKGEFRYAELNLFKFFLPNGKTAKTSIRDSEYNILSVPYAEGVLPDLLLIKKNETLHYYAEMLRAAIEHVDSGALPGSPESPRAKAIRQYIKGSFPYDPVNAGGRAAIDDFLLKATPNMITIWVVSESKTSALETMLAAREYELKHGTLPETLEQLVPEYLPAMPTDFLAGTPIRYSQKERAVWTIGRPENRVPEPLPKAEAHADCEFNVFRLPAPAAPK